MSLCWGKNRSNTSTPSPSQAFPLNLAFSRGEKELGRETLYKSGERSQALWRASVAR